MKSRTISCLILVFIALLCIAAAGYANSWFVTVIAAPTAAVAMIGALVQVYRDERSYDRTATLQALQQSHAVGAASHMATVAFDKHVIFCEAYVDELQTAFRSLLHTGPSEEALASAAKLFAIRQRSTLWITRRMAVDLEKFETALQRIAANAQWIDMELDHPNRSVVVGEMFSVFAEVMGMATWENQPISEERAVETVIQKLREVLGIDGLTELREALVTQALKNAGV